MLDTSAKNLVRLTEKFGLDFWQLRTPLTKYRIAKVPYAVDNGCFTQFKRKEWERLLTEAHNGEPPVFVTLPDVVADAARTLDLFDVFSEITEGLPRALVLQEGIENFRLPWNEIDAVFVGGGDSFKISPPAINCARVAKMLGKWVHVGRVNSAGRVSSWIGLADSIDGSGISRFDDRLKTVIDAIRDEKLQLGIGL